MNSKYECFRRTALCGRALIASIATLVMIQVVLFGFSACEKTESEKTENSTETTIKEEETEKERVEFSFVVCGDSHGTGPLIREVFEAAKEHDFLIICGDITAMGSAQEFEEFRNMADPKGVEYYTVPGNHDTYSGGYANYEKYFGERWYSFDHKNTHFVMLDNADASIGFCEEQLEWLRSDLASTEQENILAFCHIPPGAPETLAPSDRTTPEARERAAKMLDICAEYGVKTVFCGHMHGHMIWRSEPVRVVITGGAGGPIHLTEAFGGFHHYMVITIKDDKVIEEVIRLEEPTSDLDLTGEMRNAAA